MDPFSGFARVGFRGVSAVLPPGWEELPGTGSMWILAHPPVPAGRFRPNLVIRAGSNGGASLLRLSTAGLAETMATLAPIHVLSVDEWPKVFDRESGQALPGRRHRFVYEADGHTVCVDRWVWVIGAGVLEATASYALEDHVGQKALFEYLVDQLEMKDHGATHVLDWSGFDLVTRSDPMPDYFASEQRRTVVEDLSRISAEQPYVPAGMVLPAAAVELFQTLGHREKLGRFDLAGQQEAVRELVRSDLLRESGQATVKGKDYLTPFVDPEARLTLTARRGSEVRNAEVWMASGRALLLADPSFYGAGDVIGREIRLMRDAHLPLALAAWAGVAPAWPLRHAPLVIDEARFDARVASESAPLPPGSDEAVGRLWNAPWSSWSITHVEAYAGFRWLHAAEAGHYSVIPVDGGMRLDAQPSSLVWDAIVRTVHTAATGAQLDLGTDVPSAWLHARIPAPAARESGTGSQTPAR